MGLDIGIITIQYLDRPQGIAYRFAWELAHEASVGGYMHGEGNNWGAFSQRQVLHLLDVFAESRKLDASAKNEILEWVKSLPWDGWEDSLAQSNTTDDNDHSPFLGYDQEQDGGLIELHFNW